MAWEDEWAQAQDRAANRQREQREQTVPRGWGANMGSNGVAGNWGNGQEGRASKAAPNELRGSRLEKNETL